MKICVTCKVGKSVDDFNKKTSSADGKQNVCKQCNSARSRKYYAENREKHLVAIKQTRRDIKNSRREWLNDYFKSHPCIDCGNKDIRVLEFDHLENKVQGVGAMIQRGRSLDSVMNEINKCEVRCKNCHTIKTYERMGGSWHDQYIN